ncbi:hypothetical protein OAA64_01485 [bacterium]|nr:hypothetical protein [bacterium]
MNELFYFNDDWKKIGVQLSGGADSAILYYAICNYFKDKSDVEIYPMTLGTEFKPWYIEGSKKIIDRVTQLTKKEPKKHIIRYSDKHKDKETISEYINQQKIMIQETVGKYKLQAVYNGLTTNPEENSMLMSIKKFYENNDGKFKVAKAHILGRDPERNSSTHKYNTNLIQFNERLQIIRPFVHGDKKLIYDVYKYYDMLEKLYPITYSCETRHQEHKFETQESHNWDHCGYCFFCCERIYAFGKLA